MCQDILSDMMQICIAAPLSYFTIKCDRFCRNADQI